MGTRVAKLLSEARSLSDDVKEVEAFLCQQLCFDWKQSTPISWDNIEDALRPTATSDAVKVKVSAHSDLIMSRELTLLDFMNT